MPNPFYFLPVFFLHGNLVAGIVRFEEIGYMVTIEIILV